MKTEKNGNSLVMFITAMLIFGTIGIFRRNIAVSSGFLACARGLLGGLFIIIYVKMKGRKVFHGISRRVLFRLITTGILMGINWILLFEAYRFTTVSVATLCYYMEPTIIILVSPIIFKERLTFRKGLCAAAAIVGMVLVSGVLKGDMEAGSYKGILMGLMAAALYSTVVIMNKKTPGVDTYERTVIQLLSAAAVMIPYLILTGDAGPSEWSVSLSVLLLTVGLIHTGAAYVLYFGSLQGLKAQSIAVFSYIDPVSALFFSAIFLKEHLSVMEIAGAVLILGAALFSEFKND